jgi:hypothetical protein
MTHTRIPNGQNTCEDPKKGGQMMSDSKEKHKAGIIDWKAIQLSSLLVHVYQ